MESYTREWVTKSGNIAKERRVYYSQSDIPNRHISYYRPGEEKPFRSVFKQH